MLKSKVIILLGCDKFSMYLSLASFLRLHLFDGVPVFTNAKKLLSLPSYHTLLIIRDKYLSDSDFMRLRSHFSKIVLFHDNDNCSINIRRYEYVDLYLKKQAYVDHRIYTSKLKSNTLYGHEYIKNGIKGLGTDYTSKIDLLSKLRLSCNICWIKYSPKNFINYLYPLTNIPGIMPVIIKIHNRLNAPKKTSVVDKKMYDVFASFNKSGYSYGEGFQRSYISTVFPKYSQSIPYNKYQNRIRRSRVCLSPFGWGEVCFRDLESWDSNSILLKPSMDHLTTFPNLYQPMLNYIPFQWDFSDFQEKLHHAVSISHNRVMSKLFFDLSESEIESTTGKMNLLAQEIFDL